MFQVTRILCPIDFSPSGDAALRLAISMAERFDASIDVVHVWSPHVLMILDATVVPTSEAVVAQLTALQARLDETVAAAAKSGQTVRGHLVQGAPVEEVLAFAVREKSHLIVMGTHGRSGLGHLLLGSIAEQVVRTAPVPVLTTAVRNA
jgi:nucleotide-binding universal stress UspA family protein